MKKKRNKIALFEGQKIRRHWDNKKELWFFAVVDVVAVVTNSDNPQVYWRVLKKRLIDEGSNETVTKCNGLKMLAPDGKMRLTDMADTEATLRSDLVKMKKVGLLSQRGQGLKTYYEATF